MCLRQDTVANLFFLLQKQQTAIQKIQKIVILSTVDKNQNFLLKPKIS